MIRNAKYGNKGYFPEIHVIQEGILLGYVTVHPRWAGFTSDDYYTASESIENGLIPSKPMEVRLNKGSFDLTGYQLVRTPFLTLSGQAALTVSSSTMSFNKVCISKLPDAKYIELLVLPGKGMLAVRKAPSGSHNTILWRREKNGEKLPRVISGNAFLPGLFSLFGWNKNTRYKLIATVHHKGDESILLFNTKDAILYYDEKVIDDTTPSDYEDLQEISEKKKKRREKAYPAAWADSFGDDYYTSQTLFNVLAPEEADWNTDKKGVLVNQNEIKNVTSKDKAAENIRQILTDLGANDE